jgi:hypothetical protein
LLKGLTACEASFMISWSKLHCSPGERLYALDGHAVGLGNGFEVLLLSRDQQCLFSIISFMRDSSPGMAQAGPQASDRRLPAGCGGRG